MRPIARSLLAVACVAFIWADAANAANRAAVGWKTPTERAAGQTGPQPISDASAVVDTRRRVVMQFDAPLTPAERQHLIAAGVTLLDYVGANAYFARIDARRASTDAVALPPHATYAIETPHKLHERLLAGDPPSWSIVGQTVADAAAEAPQQPVDLIACYVLFHRDVSLQTDAIDVVIANGGLVRDFMESVNGLVIEAPLDVVDALAADDAVMWIEPALPPLDANNAENRALTNADVVQASPYNLDGAGVTVFVYDAGAVRATHLDFDARVTLLDSAIVAEHATHVAGIIGGDGGVSGGVYRGMAPGVALLSSGLSYSGGGVPLYANPGDFEADANTALGAGADISNNSLGSNIEANSLDCALQGDYGVMSALIDAVVRGDNNGLPFRIVWAAGNERQGDDCDVEGYGDYYSIAPPSGCKNALVVGSVDADSDDVSWFSSWGPTDDGRMKPDVVAPGCQTGGDGGVTSTSATSDTAYAAHCGTSMAAPTVSGLAALLLQDYRAQFPSRADFRSATLKVLLAHTAVDIEQTGPDYRSGYGSVRIDAAVDFMRSEQFIEREIDQDDVYRVTVSAAPSDHQLKVTLAWDDVPGTPNVSPALVNDLDLRVVGPTGTVYYPWTLNPLNPSAAAVRTQADHVNNLEQVYISNPAPGAYRVEVIGYNVPEGPQTFSLAASPTMADCSSAGVIELDHAYYSCASSVDVTVVDCDLNANDGVIETTTVVVASDTEPGGEVVTLTETGAATARFVGSATLSLTDSAGVIAVTEGDALTAEYIDADDGMGGVNVVVQADAVIDCQPPIVSNVHVAALNATSATIAFDTDEAAWGAAYAGLNCSSLGVVETERLATTQHEVTLTNLTPETTYFYAVEAVDAATNATFDDNGGACRTFTTPPQPDVYTERFTSAPDVAGLMLTFTPTGVVGKYDVCQRSADLLDTQLVAPTELSLTDDSAVELVLADGATFPFFGVAYDSVYVGSNGYVTFGEADTENSPSADTHLSLPRVSGLFADLDPEDSGRILAEQFADRFVVRYEAVPGYSVGGANTFQIELFFDGVIRCVYESLSTTNCLVGLSDGGGLPDGFTYSDFSAFPSCCVSRGELFLDGLRYACGDVVNITVLDCDLNANASLAETVNVVAASTTNPAGLTVTLTETAADSAVFVGQVALSAAVQSQKLLVAHGDIVDVSYVDADDGAGGVNVTVNVEADVDCQAPLISSVTAAALSSSSVLVSLDTAEPALGTVYYGATCTALSRTASGLGYATPAQIVLTDLTPETTYFFAVAAEDELGNWGFDMNGGACYTFVTPPTPTYFTQLFLSGNDLDYTTLRFTPDDSSSHYTGCATPAAVLPTDPAGGTVLTLTDDESVRIDLHDGKTIEFFGVEYEGFWVGSNGYVTFNEADVDAGESLTDHFAQPRISALFDDLDPTSSTVSWRQTTDRVAVTYEDVPEYGSSLFSTFQIEVYFNGVVSITYLNVAGQDGLAGISSGGGVQADYETTDLSAMAICWTIGDMNCDGAVNAFDIDPFVLALVNADDYAAAYPNCDALLADINDDGVVNAFDIDPFVTLLVSQ